MIQRAEIKELTARLKEPRKFIQVIVGPRQVGKTTMVSQADECRFMGTASGIGSGKLSAFASGEVSHAGLLLAGE